LDYTQTPPDELRRLYIRATPRQRYKVAIERITNAASGPSLLVTVMSALEGFARCVAVRGMMRDGHTFDGAYGRLRNLGPVELIADYICAPSHIAPQELCGTLAWAQLPEAVSFRNLLVHEATYLHGGTCKRLTSAARHILDTLAKREGAL